MTLSPTDRTKLNNLSPNLTPNAVAISALRLQVFQEIYTYLDSIISDLNSAQATGSVTSAKLADGSVITVKIADSNVTSGKIADGAIVELKLANGAVTTVKLADLAVTTAKIADLAVTQAKIANGAVGPTQLQTGLAATVDVNAQFAKRGIDITSSPFFAKGDGVANDTAAIQAAADYAFANGYTLIGVGTFKITSTLILKCNVNMPDATFEYYGTGTAIVVGDSAVRTDNLIQLLPSVSQTTKIWGSDIGVQLVNVYASQIQTQIISNFGTGLMLTSLGTNGCVYNTITIGHLLNNKTNLLLMPGDVDAWVNENLFIGGRYSYLSTEGTDVADACNIKIRGFTGATGQPNNNTFIKPSVEGDVPFYSLDIHGGYNTFIQGRYEGSITRRVIFRTIGSVSSRRNVILHGYLSEALSVTEESSSQWNELVTSSRNVQAGSADVLQTYKNTGSSANAVYRILDTSQSPYNTATTIYSVQQSANKTEMKRSTDSFNRIEIDHGNGKIFFGDGTIAPAKEVRNSTAGIEIVGGLFLNGNAWDTNLFRLGSYRFWVDSTGEFRMKNGTPTGDTDGNLFSTFRAVPATATSTGTPGDWAADANFAYFCYAANTWRRVAVASW